MKKKFILATTIPGSLNFFRSQISEIDKYFDVCLLSNDEPKLVEIGKREKVKVKGIKMKREISLFSDFLSFIKILCFFNQEKPDIIHCNTPKASLLCLLAGKICFIKNRIYYVHGLRYEGTNGLKRVILRIMEKLSMSFATNVISVSPSLANTIKKEFGIDSSVIGNGSPNGIDLDYYVNSIDSSIELNHFQNIEINVNSFVFIFVGRIVKDKGIIELINSFLKINENDKNALLFLVGNFGDPHNLPDSIIRAINECSEIYHFGYQHDIRPFVNVSNILVSPSYREGFGLTIAEANALGKAVLCTNITGYSDIVVDGFNGFLVSPRNTLELYQKMKELMHKKDALIDIGRNGREFIYENFDRKEVIKNAINYYRKFI